MNDSGDATWLPELGLVLTHDEIELRRSMARVALQEAIEGEVIIHNDDCAWSDNQLCACGCVLLFRSRTKITAVGADRSQCTVRVH